MIEVLPTPETCPTCDKALTTPERRWLYCAVCGGFPRGVESPTDFFIGGTRFSPGKYVIREVDVTPPENAMSDAEWERWQEQMARPLKARMDGE